MSIPLNAIPKVIVSAIQEKMTPPTFCRLRQTCHEMDEFTEKNRFKTKTLYPEDGVLLITVGEETKTGYDFEIVPFQDYIENSLKAYRQKLNKFTSPSIIDPYNQLSALCFDIIIVNYSTMAELFFESYSFKKLFLPLMQKLRLECNSLVFLDIDYLRPHYAQNLIIKRWVHCESLENRTALRTSEYQPIKSLKREVLGFFLDMPKNLGSMVGHLEYAMLGKRKSNNESFVSLLEEFLEDVSINKSAQGNLKRLILETNQTNKLTKPSGLVNLWQGEAHFLDKKQNLRLQKLSIDNGAVMIAHFPEYRGTYVVTFLKCYIRQTLYDFLSQSMLTEIFESPGVYDSFFAAKDDVTAMEALNPAPPPSKIPKLSTD